MLFINRHIQSLSIKCTLYTLFIKLTETQTLYALCPFNRHMCFFQMSLYAAFRFVLLVTIWAQIFHLIVVKEILYLGGFCIKYTCLLPDVTHTYNDIELNSLKFKKRNNGSILTRLQTQILVEDKVQFLAHMS